MSNQEKFAENFDKFQDEFPLQDFVGGDIKSDISIVLGDFECKDVKNEYDFDGQADLESVYFFKDLDLYVKFIGYYRSFSGTHFSKYEFVNPIEKLVTIYE